MSKESEKAVRKLNKYFPGQPLERDFFLRLAGLASLAARSGEREKVERIKTQLAELPVSQTFPDLYTDAVQIIEDDFKSKNEAA